MPEEIPDILALRYASPRIIEIWSDRGRIVLERQFWIAVMKAQRDAGVEIPTEAIKAYEAVTNRIDLNSIRRREAKLRHDVKARIEEFCDLAGHEHIHKGLTSRDLTDNVEQFQIHESLKYIQLKYVALLVRLSVRAREWRDLVVVGRTHNVPAQPTTMGKRLATSGEEMLQAFRRLEGLIAGYPLRGLKGAVGTALDQLTLLAGSVDSIQTLQNQVLRHLGFERELSSVGQVYPRSLDFDVVSCLLQMGAGVSNLARTVRLMAGTEAATEGFASGQVGSSAMPHKMNTRSSERINGFQAVLGGFCNMLGSIAGDQWYEGDVSCSVVRRVALPGSFFTIDGMLETAWHVVDDMGVYSSVIRNELDRFMPFLATTTLLMEAVQRGAGRENAHEAIKEHAVAAALAMREEGIVGNDLAQRLGNDQRVPLNAGDIEELIRQSETLVGLAGTQVDQFGEAVDRLADDYPEASQLEKNPLL